MPRLTRLRFEKSSNEMFSKLKLNELSKRSAVRDALIIYEQRIEMSNDYFKTSNKLTA